jgi:hypothetical protein
MIFVCFQKLFLLSSYSLLSTPFYNTEPSLFLGAAPELNLGFTFLNCNLPMYVHLPLHRYELVATLVLSISCRVTRWVSEKIAQYVAQPIFCKNLRLNLFV